MRSAFRSGTLKLSVGALLCGSAIVSAGTIDLYHLGESDSPPGVDGNAGDATTVDSVGANNLSGAGKYSSNVRGGIGSTISMAFNGSQGYSAGVVTTATDNIGISAWVYPTAVNTSEIAYNGNGGNDGFGLFEAGPANGFNPPLGYATVIGLLGGASYGPSANIPLNTWSKLTIVLQGGADSLYVDGVLAGSVSNGAHTPNNGFPFDSFGIGGGFNGNIDEVNVFTVPEPGSIASLALGGLGLLARRRQT